MKAREAPREWGGKRGGEKGVVNENFPWKEVASHTLTLLSRYHNVKMLLSPCNFKS